MSSNKKAKVGEDDDAEDFEKVRRYLMECPQVSSNHPAIKAALNGIDQEIKRRERDAKLQRKFMQGDAVTVEKPAVAVAAADPSARPTTRGEKKDTKAYASTAGAEQQDETMADDWQDVTTDPSKEQEDEEGAYLGSRLAKEAIASIALNEAHVESPLAAIALALHAAMRSKALGFACTGIPEDNVAASSGFAAPIRELPKTHFLPPNWDKDKDPNHVALRYRKPGTGSVILDVHQHQQSDTPENMVVVTLYPTSTQERPSESLTFPLSDYINLESWNRAVRQHPRVAPALHYKSLAQLMTKFAETFDLGHVHEHTAMEESAEKTTLPYVDTTVENLPARQTKSQFNDDFNVTGPAPVRPLHPIGRDGVQHPWDDSRPPTIETAFPLRSSETPHGDFAGDLAPGGITGPRFGHLDPSQGGNLMGPNHPMFHGGMSGVGPDSGFGMRPRFDPFGPPGGPTDPEPDNNSNNTSGRGRRPGGSGNPNPDHLRPPKDLNNNMFM